MSVFEQLNPYVSLCQACGLIPYTIEYNLIIILKATNKFSIRIVVDYTLLFRIFYVRWLRERLSRMTYLTFSRTSA
jgi:hypothetical protein